MGSFERHGISGLVTGNVLGLKYIVLRCMSTAGGWRIILPRVPFGEECFRGGAIGGLQILLAASLRFRRADDTE